MLSKAQELQAKYIYHITQLTFHAFSFFSIVRLFARSLFSHSKGTDKLAKILKTGAKQNEKKMPFQNMKQRKSSVCTKKKTTTSNQVWKREKAKTIQFDKSYSWAARKTLNLSTCLIYLFIIFDSIFSTIVVDFFPVIWLLFCCWCFLFIFFFLSLCVCRVCPIFLRSCSYSNSGIVF